MTWEKYRASHFSYYSTCILPNYKTIFYIKLRNNTQWNLLEPIPFSTIWTISSIWFRSHSLRSWVMRLVHDAHFVINKFRSEYHSFIQCITFDRFPHIFKPTLEFLPLSQYAFSIVTFISKVLEYRELLLTLSYITRKCFWSSRSYLTSEENNKIKLFLSLYIALDGYRKFGKCHGNVIVYRLEYC